MQNSVDWYRGPEGQGSFCTNAVLLHEQKYGAMSEEGNGLSQMNRSMIV